MFKQISSGLSKFFTKERVLVIGIFIILAWALLSYAGAKNTVQDTMGGGYDSLATPQQQQQINTAKTNVAASAASNGYAMQPVANPSELLPTDQNSQWSALNPSTMNQGSVLMPDLLQAGYHIGLDTIGQTLRNPNLQLRSDPIIQKADIGPWNQSTIEPDLGRVPLELGN
jgi:hypothetical protein